MNGPAHWAKGEEHLARADAIETDGDEDSMSAWHQRQAQVHMTAAATAAWLAVAVIRPDDRDAWDHAMGITGVTP
jgi:hypothetical protein